LDLARIEAGRLELADEPVALPALMREVMAFLQPLAERKQLRLQLSVDPRAPEWVRGDALRLKQILLNLGTNAIKFTDQGEVELRLGPAPAGERILLAVSDTGPGLNPDQCARLFQRFSQADGLQTARRYGGSGLGLAICQELAAAMGGQIEVTSKVGAGTTFCVALPLQRCEVPVTSADPVPAHAPSDASALRILLVEDDATVAAVVAELLGLLGHAVTRVPHGLAALSELTGTSFDLAVLDLDLPGVDGMTLARMIRAQGHAFPLIALTARADPEAEPQARAAGMAAFLRKPVSRAQLAGVIAAVVPSAVTA
jgi:CheY-like chemotaxis protein/two-component sensor histidine kinase